jgi:hypothetical protein
VGSQRNCVRAWLWNCLLVECMLGRCRHVDCRLDTKMVRTTEFCLNVAETNLGVEAHSHALHIHLVHGSMRNYSEGAVQIVIVDCD